MIATARLKYLGVSAQKTRLVVDLVRGKSVGVALANLRYSRKLVAKDLEKLLQSALANAQRKDPKLDVTAWWWRKQRWTKARLRSARA